MSIYYMGRHFPELRAHQRWLDVCDSVSRDDLSNTSAINGVEGDFCPVSTHKSDHAPQLLSLWLLGT